MDLFENIVIKNIRPPSLAHFERNTNSTVYNRPTYGLALCISGRNQYTINGKTFMLEPGYAMLLPQNATYDINSFKDGAFPFIDFTCENFDVSDMVVFPLENTKALLSEYDKIKNLFLFQKSQLLIFSEFYRILNKLSQMQRPLRTPLAPALDYIEEHIADPSLSNSVLASTLGISEVYLRKLFSSHYGTSPKQYILNIRINKAKQLLTDTSLTVHNVSEQCGFSSPYHFCQIFRKKAGLSPSAYAKQNRISKF